MNDISKLIKDIGKIMVDDDGGIRLRDLPVMVNIEFAIHSWDGNPKYKEFLIGGK